MYQWHELRHLTVKPRINDISLRVLQEYYENCLYPFFFHYRIEESGNARDIELRFDKRNFCHLLGIERVMQHSVSVPMRAEYRGLRGWDNIKAGKFDIRDLRRANRKKFASMKAKYVYFYLIPSLVRSPNGVLFDSRLVPGNVSIRSEILFYSDAENDRAVIHLGIDRDEAGYYIPRTFFVEKVGSFENDKYIMRQKIISVGAKDRTITL